MKELFAAVEQSDYYKLQQLLEQKPDDNSLNINAKDKDGNTLLHLAATKGQVKILELLLQAGADLDLQDAQGRTPLVVAKKQQQEAAAQYLATYAKREIIEPINIAERRHPTDARWSSIQFASSPEEQDTESLPLLAQNLPPDVAQLLVQCQLNERELEKAMVKLGELKRLLKKSPYGHVLYSLAIQRFLQKVAMWPLLTKRAIQQPENKNASKEKNEGEELRPQPSKDSFFTRHLWPKNKSVLVSDPKVLKKVYGINGFFDGAGFVINRGWTGLILVLLGLDIYNYYAYPFDREITNTTLSDIFLGTASNEKSLSTLLLDPKIWPGILALPLLWGLGKAIFATHQKDWDDKTIEKITAQLSHYRPNVWKDLVQWFPALVSFGLLPDPTIKRLLNQIERALLWDGHLSSQERLKLFQAVRQLARTASQLTRLQALSILAGLADGVSPYDFPKLVEAGIDKEMLQTLLYLKTEAFADLRNFAERRIYSEENEPITVSRFHAAYAHYQLWRLGQPQSYALQPLFWGITLAQFYLQGYLLWRVIQSVINLITFYVDKQECLNAGKLWLYMDHVADYVCSVCGDWPIFYKDIFTDKSCWEGYLQDQHTAEEIVKAIQRLNFQDIFVADFSNQNFTGEDLGLVLPALKIKAPNLQALSLNTTMPIDVPPLSGAHAIADFIRDSSIKQLDLSNEMLTDNGTVIIAQALPDSVIQTLNLDSNVIGADGAEALAKALPGSSIQFLALSINHIGDEGIEALAKALPGSSVHSLDLWENNISDAGVEALASVLHNSSVHSLDLQDFFISNAGVQVLANALSSSSVNALTLGGIINDVGAEAIAKALHSSSVHSLKLGNNIGDAGAEALAKALPGSLVKTLYLSNNITDAGVEAIAKVLYNSSVNALSLVGGHITDASAEAIAKALPGSLIQFLGLNGNIGDAGAEALAKALPDSSVQSLDLSENHIGDAGAEALAKALPDSSVHSLDLWENNISAAGAQAIAKALPGSSIQSLDLSSNNIGDVGVEALAKVLPGSLVQTLNLGSNNISNAGALVFANTLTTFSVDHSFFSAFNFDTNKALAKANPNTKLEILDLGFNKIGNEGALALCRVLPQTEIEVENLFLDGNPITQVNINTCYISSAHSNSPFWLFGATNKVYQVTVQFVQDSYRQAKDYFAEKSNDVSQKEMDENANKTKSDKHDFATPTQNSKIFVAINNTPVLTQNILSTDPNYFLPTTPTTSSTASDETSSLTSESNKSIGEKFIIGQLLVGLVKKYSPFTLPWNREHSLTTQEQATLKHHQKQLQQLAQNFKHQCKSRAATFESVADRFVYIDDHLPKVQQAITKAFNHNKITNAQIQEITTTFNRLQECNQAIAKENQRLRKLEVKEYRQLRRTAKAGREQPAFKYSYDVVNQTLKHEVVKEKEPIPVIPAWTPESRTQGSEIIASLPTGSLLPYSDDKKVEPVSFAFGLLQQFWSRGDKVNAQPMVLEQAQQDNIPKLPT